MMSVMSSSSVAPKAVAATPTGEAWPTTRWIALAVAITAGFMDLLDTTIVNVAIPAIRQDLGTSYASIEWIVSGYLLTFGVMLITGGRLGDIYGRRRVFVLGVIGFGATSLLSGVAPSGEVLIVARMLQGLSAAAMIPQILAMVRVNFPRDEQAKAVSIYSALAGVATMSGPMLAGVLLEVDLFGLGWRAIFLLNVPITVFVVFGALRWMPESRSSTARTLDLGGVALISLALFSLVFALIEGRQRSWPAWSFVMLAAFVPLLLAFVRHERRVERRGGAPLVPLSLFADRAFAIGTLAGLVFFSSLVGFFLVFTVFLQLGLGFTPLESALTTFPSSVGLVIAALASQRLAPKLGRRLLHLGTALMALAMLGLLLTVDHHGTELSAWDVRPVILFFGLGMGMTLPLLADFVLANIDPRDAGAGSGVLNSGLQVGNVLGVVFTGLILFTALGSGAPSGAATATAALDRQLAATGLPAEARTSVVARFEACFVDRSRGEDPSAVPASCQEPAGAALPAAAQAAVDRAGETANARNFVSAIQPALAFVIGVLVLTFGLMFLLPRWPRTDDLPLAVA